MFSEEINHPSVSLPEITVPNHDHLTNNMVYMDNINDGDKTYLWSR